MKTKYLLITVLALFFQLSFKIYSQTIPVKPLKIEYAFSDTPKINQPFTLQFKISRYEEILPEDIPLTPHKEAENYYFSVNMYGVKEFDMEKMNINIQSDELQLINEEDGKLKTLKWSGPLKLNQPIILTVKFDIKDIGDYLMRLNLEGGIGNNRRFKSEIIKFCICQNESGFNCSCFNKNIKTNDPLNIDTIKYWYNKTPEMKILHPDFDKFVDSLKRGLLGQKNVIDSIEINQHSNILTLGNINFQFCYNSSQGQLVKTININEEIIFILRKRQKTFILVKKYA